jgi:hypothetical protein
LTTERKDLTCSGEAIEEEPLATEDPIIPTTTLTMVDGDDENDLD